MFRGVTEWRARGKTYAELNDWLRRSNATTMKRMTGLDDNRRNRIVANHITAIECWGQRRLRVFLGMPPTFDECDDYAPGIDLPIAELRERFRTARAETISILQQIEQQGVDLDQTVAHNELGDLTLRAWVGYLADHSARESNQFRLPQWVPTS
jgi:hypothetical protein